MKVGIIGSGAWGTALAGIFDSRQEVILYSKNPQVADDINNNRCNSKYLPKIFLADNISATSEIDLLACCDVLLIATPVAVLNEVASELKSVFFLEGRAMPIVVCSKGIDINTVKLPLAIVNSVLPNHSLGFLSGPNFAQEVASGLLAMTTIASNDERLLNVLEASIDKISIEITTDIIGIQLCAALKNIMAIASGVLQGLGIGNNGHAALITSGINEIAVICEYYGGDYSTILKSCGIGDLVLTCGSSKSRNMSFGMALAKGVKFDQDLLVEGYFTVKALHILLKDERLNAPICQAMYKIIYENGNPSILVDSIFAVKSTCDAL